MDCAKSRPSVNALQSFRDVLLQRITKNLLDAAETCDHTLETLNHDTPYSCVYSLSVFNVRSACAQYEETNAELVTKDVLSESLSD